MRNLEKTLHLDSFRHVFFQLSQGSKKGASSVGTSQQPPPEVNIPATSTPKGKEVETTEQPTMTDQPKNSKEQGQEPTPPPQTKAVETPVLQTPLNEERGRKRDKETTTPASRPMEQPGTKRQRLNPLSEEEMMKETIDSHREERAVSQETSPMGETSLSSQRQELEKQHSAEVSSTRPQSKHASYIKNTFTEIKSKNDPVRLQIYSQYLKMAPLNQQRLMSSYDIKEGKMIMSYFKPKMQQPESPIDFIRTNLEVLTKDIHPMDQIELHKQTREMVYSTLTDKEMTAHKLQNSLDNTATQIHLEKASSPAKDNGIKVL